VTIRVLLADDQPLLRLAYQTIIDSAPDLNVVAEAATGRETVDLARKTTPDVALVDIRMPDLDGLAATELITADPALAGVRVLIITTFEYDEYVYRAIRAGASGFLGKGLDPEELLDAIRVVHRGEALLSPTATKALIDRYHDQGSPTGSEPSTELAVLTLREREVLTLVARGLSNNDIAAALVISEHTAKTHVKRTMAKLGARDRAQLVVIAYESGLVHRQTRNDT
jgi:DNA-binding NarL/FixJ family response regulator